MLPGNADGLTDPHRLSITNINVAVFILHSSSCFAPTSHLFGNLYHSKMYQRGTGYLAMAFAASTLLSLVANSSLVQLRRIPTMIEVAFYCLVSTALVFVLDRLILYPRFRSTMKQSFPAMLVR